MTTIESLNTTARNVAEDMHRRFPDLSLESVRFCARFVSAAGHLIRACNDRLATEGKELNQKGLERCFEEAAKLAE